MTDILLRSWNWVRRFRHRCGYGVHSPSDFFLITFVIYEKGPFYAYSLLHDLRKQVQNLPHYREKVDKLLLRLVNHLQPTHLFEIGTGSGLSTRYMVAGNTKMSVTTWSLESFQEVKELFSSVQTITYAQGREQEVFQTWKRMTPSKTMVHLAHTPYYKEAFEKLLPLVDANTCFVIGSPYADEAKKRWWKEIIADERTGVTFDLYDIGLIFFDKKRVKEHRIVNFL